MPTKSSRRATMDHATKPAAWQRVPTCRVPNPAPNNRPLARVRAALIQISCREAETGQKLRLTVTCNCVPGSARMEALPYTALGGDQFFSLVAFNTVAWISHFL